MDSPVSVSHYLFSRHWKCIFETNPSFWLVDTGCLASENQFFFSIFHILLTFKAYCKFIFTTNPLFWPVETDSLANGKHFVPNPQLSFLLEAVFPTRGKILNTFLGPVAQQIFSLMGWIFFHSYFL